MKLARNILIAAGVVLMVVGIIIMAATVSTKGFYIKDYAEEEYEEKEYKFSGKVDSIDIDSSVADVEFFINESDELKVEIKQSERIQYDVAFNNGELKIKSDKKHGINLFFDGLYTDLHIYVYLPNTEIDNIKIDGSVGSVKIPAITCNDMKLDLSTGATELKGVLVKNDLDIDSSTGSVRLIDVKAGKMELDVSTGSIYFENCEADEIDADASTGSIKGTLKGDYDYKADSSTGSVSVPSSSGSRRCKLSASTGCIDIKKAK